MLAPVQPARCSRRDLRHRTRRRDCTHTPAGGRSGEGLRRPAGRCPEKYGRRSRETAKGRSGLMPDFLLEIGCEEIPSRMLQDASQELQKRVEELLTKNSLP